MLDDATVPMTNALKCNLAFIFASQPNLTKKNNKASVVQKKNTNLVTQLFLSLQSRTNSNIAEFFKFKNQVKLSVVYYDQEPNRIYWTATCHLEETQTQQSALFMATVVVLDLAAVIHMLRPTSLTFNGCMTKLLMPYLDIIGDNYPVVSLKSITHQHCGSGPKTRMRDGHKRFLKIKKTKGNYFLSLLMTL